MLPAYFASSFQNRGLLVAMTFLFGTGVATVILPLAMGASALRQLFTQQHTIIYVAGGLIMLALGLYTLLGGQLHIPVPGRRAGGKGGPLSVYSLGVFSGVASSCCAPVLAGVIALSSVASSFGLALGLGAAYVFGMVAPLFTISLLWERYDWRKSRLFRPRTFTYRLGPLRRTITGTSLASGILLVLMGAATLYVGLAFDAMPASSGWQAQLSVRLQSYGQALTEALSWVPGWAAAVALIIVVCLLAWRALGQVRSGVEPDEESREESEETEEDIFEYRDA
jgi:cytochrome c-type biogenesis protein